MMKPINPVLQESSMEGSFSGDKSSSAEDACLSESGNHEINEDKPREELIAKKETKDVVRLKLLVLLVLTCSAVGIALSTFYHLTSNERSQFFRHFNNDSHKVMEAIGRSLDKTLGSFDGVAVTLVSHARAANQSWPFVTLPDFAVRMSKVLPLSDALILLFLPLVRPEQRDEWEEYSVKNDYWVNEAVAVQDKWDGFFGPTVYNDQPFPTIRGDVADIPRNISRPMLPIWQNFPVVGNSLYTYNWDWLSVSKPEPIYACLETHKAVISAPYLIPTPGDAVAEAESELWAQYFKDYISPDEEPMEPVSDLHYPIVETIDQVYVAGASDYDPSNHTAVGTLSAQFYWRAMIRNILPPGSNGIHVVIDTACTEAFTYEINGPTARYIGVGDHHEAKYSKYGIHSKLNDLGTFAMRDSTYSGAKLDDEYCPFSVHLYPSDAMKAAFTTTDPIIFTAVVIVIFAFTSLVLYLYDAKVERRQQTVMSTAVRTNAIVSALFPSNVRDRLYPAETTEQQKFQETTKGKIHNFLNERNGNTASSASISSSSKFDETPIAELYTDTTVLFADIAGFTAWSSERQPTQVFRLLETIYAAFDAIAKRRGVFKVETIGDCYVAVVGLPTPRKHHAVVMARFAQDCRNKMTELTLDLEKALGPGTAELALRIGLNSGPTTAGVLRGEKSRFQLFGDTVNTAARMESNGERNRIHVSEKTAELIKSAGKGHWLLPRDEMVEYKGKGKMTSYWCEPKSTGAESAASVVSNTASSSEALDPLMEPKTKEDMKRVRLIDWNVDMFTRLLQDVVDYKSGNSTMGASQDSVEMSVVSSSLTPLEMVTEVLDLPSPMYRVEPSVSNLIDPIAVQELRVLITEIAASYPDNASFHNFAHSSHVAMSAGKLLDRFTERAKEEEEQVQGCSSTSPCMVISHPLTKFAIVYAALVHDVGVSNVQHHELAKDKFNDKTKQNSACIAWNMLVEKQKYTHLRRCLFETAEQMQQFRQILVHCVMATDLLDIDLKLMRNQRWDKAFGGATNTTDRIRSVVDDDGTNNHDVNLLATIVMELILQASAVSHTMQHVTVYKTWNIKLLTEVYDTYRTTTTTTGRCGEPQTSCDPCDSWYEHELQFFDNCVLPLARKLKLCSSRLGVSCTEYLDYALDNRKEWEIKGCDLVLETKERLEQKYYKSLVNNNETTTTTTPFEV